MEPYGFGCLFELRKLGVRKLGKSPMEHGPVFPGSLELLSIVKCSLYKQAGDPLVPYKAVFKAVV